MSENGSNASIEEIGPEEIEEIQFNDETEGQDNVAEVLIPDDNGDKSEIKPEDDDPPLETLEPVVPAAPLSEPEPAAEPATEPAPAATEPEVEPIPVVSEPTPQAAEPSPAEAESAVLVTEPAPAVAEPAPVAAEPAPAAEPFEIIEEVPRPAPQNPPQSRVVRPRAPVEEDEEDDDDIDETLTERLIGLTEMFPESVRSGTVSLVKGSWSGSQYLYGLSRSIAWIFFSTASVLFMPVMIETERLSILDQQKQQKTQMLLGPGVASSGAPSLGPPPI